MVPARGPKRERRTLAKAIGRSRTRSHRRGGEGAAKYQACPRVKIIVDYALKSQSLKRADNLRWILLVLPIYFYIVTAWVIRPLSVNNIALAYVVPLCFVTGFLLLNIPKWEINLMLRRVWIELALALLMGLLSILSVINSSEPIRILRILFPSILPVLLFFQLAALRSISPKSVERLPRDFMIAGFAFACLPLFLSFVSSGVHKYTFEDGYRFMGLFDHEAQLSAMVAVMVPLIITEIAVSRKPFVRWMWITLLIVVFYTLTRVGAKTAMFITMGYAWLFYIIAHLRFQSLLKNVLLASVVLVLMIFLGFYGLSIATAIDPILGAKIAAVFDQGVENYGTIQSRSELWREAWEQGTRHWLIGSGAGESILGMQHAHNLILDYFRGIGIFGALAIGLLCCRIVWRTIDKTFDVMLAKSVSSLDVRILGCFSAATVYVLCNQLSNSFGPATISALWMIYLPAVMTEPVRSRSRLLQSAARRVSHAG